MLTGGRGDDSYVAIIKEQYPAMYSYGMHFVNNESLVKDCIQDVFVSLWDRRQRTDAIEHMRSYLFSALRRRLLRVMEQSRTRDSAADRQSEDTGFQVEFTIEDAIIARQLKDEQAQKLQHILSQLSSRQKEVIHLVYYQELNVPDAARAMGINTQSAHNLLHESLKKIRAFWQSLPE